MSKITRKRVIDSDTGERASIANVDLANADAEAIRPLLEAVSRRGRLRKVNARLAKLAGLAEFKAAAREIMHFKQFDARDEWQRADAALSRFGLIYQSALREKFQRDSAPALKRDQLREAGNKKPRRGRMPQLDKWLDAVFRRNSDTSNNELWLALPQESGGVEMYRDGETVYEYVNGRERETHRAGFNSRVTAARRRRARR